MPSDAVIKLRPLRIRQRCRVRFQAFPDRVEQFRLLRRGEVIYLASQIAHMAITLARFLGSGKPNETTNHEMQDEHISA
jgi:hypothetical protein